jgi:hypothetical protein
MKRDKEIVSFRMEATQCLKIVTGWALVNFLITEQDFCTYITCALCPPVFYYCLPLTSLSTISGSARVEVSPRESTAPSAIFLSILRIILPLLVLGSPSVK